MQWVEDVLDRSGASSSTASEMTSDSPDRAHCHHPVTPIHLFRCMDVTAALDCLAALAQPTRLATFQLLLAKEPHGLPAGEVARQLAVPQNTMSSHLSHLSSAGLARSERRSRSINYRADLARFGDLIRYLIEDCGEGRPEACGVLLAGLSLPQSDITQTGVECSCGG